MRVEGLEAMRKTETSAWRLEGPQAANPNGLCSEDTELSKKEFLF